MKVRMKFSKLGSMRFIGHLDTMRFFQKAFRRCSIDVAYSQGYSPHQIMSFASPLGVGLTSEGEYLDVQFNSLPDDGKNKQEVLKQINQAMTGEIFITDYTILPEDSKPSMALVAAADYIVTIKDGYSLSFDFFHNFESFMKADTIVITKKTKKSEKEVDLKPYIYKYEQRENGLFLQLTAGSVCNIKPEMVLEAYHSFCNQEMNPFAFSIHRLEMYADKNAKKGECNTLESGKQCLISLNDFI